MKILFMCVANSARSQIAEGLAKKHFPDFEIQSAGSNPGSLNPFAIKVMDEIGVDIRGQYSKSVEMLPAQFVLNLDFVITLCQEEVCPQVFAPRAKRMHLPFKDPARKPGSPKTPELEILSDFRKVRDEIQTALLLFQKENLK